MFFCIILLYILPAILHISTCSILHFENHVIFILHYRAIPRIFCLRGQTPQTFTGISCIQTGFLVKHYVRKKKLVFPVGATAPPPPAPRYVRPCIICLFAFLELIFNSSLSCFVFCLLISFHFSLCNTV